MEKPSTKPNNPNFSSGPCSKRPGWTIDALKNTPIGRSHRHKVCKEKLNMPPKSTWFDPKPLDGLVAYDFE